MYHPEKCDLCGDCLFLCPYEDMSREEAVEQVRELLQDGTPPIVGSCVTCAACNSLCPRGVNPFHLIVKRQEESGVPEIPQANLSLFENLPRVPSQVLEGKSDEVLCLCSVGDLLPGLFEVPLFRDLTVVKGGDYFCGVGWLHLGRLTPFAETARKALANLEKLERERIVFYHDDCYALFASLAGELGLEPSFKPVHVIEYVLERLKSGDYEIGKLGLKAAYQQPCASRYTPWKDAWLDELFSLLGVERVARRYDREKALCCGSPLMPRDRDRAMAIKGKNLQDAVEHGASAMVYLCPLCVLNLRKPASEANLENHHLLQLVDMAMGD